MAGVPYILSLLVALSGLVTERPAPLDARAANVPPCCAGLVGSVATGPAVSFVDLGRTLLVQARVPRIRIRHFASLVESDPTEDIRDGRLDSLTWIVQLTALRSQAQALDFAPNAPSRPSFLCLCRFLC